MADGMLKAEKDFTKEVDKQLPEAQELSKVRAARHHNDWPILTCVH